ncbi:MAG TPA: hypothetical protein VEL28_11100 [Candidatus Binatia bacterium]|nr:hypothetical protein [Candidatus Binatia bacterium]
MSLWVLYLQINENTRTNKVAIRGQLYQTEANLALEDATDDAQVLSTLWALVPPRIQRQEYARALLSLATTDETALKATNAASLYHSVFDAKVFSSRTRRRRTAALRRMFLTVQTNFYHVHNAFDYKGDGILDPEEFLTWKGLLREMSAHPLLLAVIWQGHRNRYFSEKFAEFIQRELCPDAMPEDVVGRRAFERNRDFVRYYYPEMVESDWPKGLPDYR